MTVIERYCAIEAQAMLQRADRVIAMDAAAEMFDENQTLTNSTKVRQK